ncbi:hypothetical protein RJ641_000190 [Dillenia turbinata]|uniref:Uncharacterized protein n=1 Tax=Dillenia turbinata TaxID=194707 RepID=A0AAN8WE68_9MAGN
MQKNCSYTEAIGYSLIDKAAWKKGSSYGIVIVEEKRYLASWEPFNTDNIKFSSSSVHLRKASSLTRWLHLLLPSKDNNQIRNGPNLDQKVLSIENMHKQNFLKSMDHFVDTVVAEAAAAVHNGKCKCGDSCACVNCTCGQ